MTRLPVTHTLHGGIIRGDGYEGKLIEEDAYHYWTADKSFWKQEVKVLDSRLPFPGVEVTA